MAQARTIFVGPALVHPVADGPRQPGRGGGVGVVVRRDVDAFAAGALDERGGLLHLSPVLLTRRLVVRQLDPRPAAAPDLEVLLDRLDQPGALVADVTRIEATRHAHLLAERAELVGRPVGAWRIDEPG